MFESTPMPRVKDASASILYSFRRCPYAIRARMMLAACGMSVVIREIKLSDKPDSLLFVSSKATVPLLLLSDGTIIEESMDIMLWAQLVGNRNPWTGHCVESEDLIRESDGEFKYWLDRYKYADRYPTLSREWLREKTLPFIERLEGLLKHSTFLGGTIADITDVALFPFVRQWAAIEPEWLPNSSYTELNAWLKAWQKDQYFLAAMRKYPIWIPDSVPVVFP